MNAKQWYQRVLPQNSSETSPAAGKYRNSHVSGCSSNHCCLLCCHSATNSSPTSTLLGLSHLSSPPMSPPLSPIKQRSLSGLSPFSRFLNSEHASGVSAGVGPHLYFSNGSYKEVLNELMNSLEAMKFNDAVSASASAASPVSVGENYRNAPWIDGFEDQQQFILSPSTSNVSNMSNLSNIASSASGSDQYQNLKINENGWSCDPDPDLGWVNDLLM